MANFTFFFYNNENEHVDQLTHDKLIDGFRWCLGVINFNPKYHILQKIIYNEEEIFKSDKNLEFQDWEFSAFIFYCGEFLDKSDLQDRKMLYLPKDGWSEKINIFDDDINFELVDDNYKFDNNGISVDLNYLRDQVYKNINKWMDELIYRNYFLTKNNISINQQVRTALPEQEYNNYCTEIFEYQQKFLTAQIRLKSMLKSKEDITKIISTYRMAPRYIMETILNRSISFRDAKYMMTMYKNSTVSEIEE